MNREALQALARSGAPVHVVGLASTEGAAVVRFLWSVGVRNLTVHDFLAGDDLRAAFFRLHVGMPKSARRQVWEQLAALPVARRFGSDYLDDVDDAAVVFVGQGWYLYRPNFPKLPDLRDRGVPMHTLTELYFDLAPVPIVAITGSNGKSTTSRLVEAMLEGGPGNVYFAGNERRSTQVLDQLDRMGPEDVLVLEVSNRQLIDLTPRPQVGVLTNVLPNHLEEHGGSFEAYAAVKRRLLAYQKPDQFALLNADDPASLELSEGLPGHVLWFSRHTVLAEGAWIEAGELRVRLAADDPAETVGTVGRLPLLGAHNESNVLAAALAARAAGASPTSIRAGLATFRPLRHRLQLVWRRDGVAFYDDLNSTSPQATVAALNALEAPVIWIAGGDDKGLAFDELALAASERVRRVMLLPGPGSARIADALERRGSAGPEVSRHDALADAVDEAAAVARPGEAVLLSPACPGFWGHYVNGAAGAGGEELGFRALVRRLGPGSQEASKTDEGGDS